MSMEQQSELAGKAYRPSSGKAELKFIAKWCKKCLFDRPHRGEYCEIFTAMLLHETDEEEYPDQWVYDEDGVPVCTAFEPTRKKKGNK